MESIKKLIYYYFTSIPIILMSVQVSTKFYNNKKPSKKSSKKRSKKM